MQLLHWQFLIALCYHTSLLYFAFSVAHVATACSRWHSWYFHHNNHLQTCYKRKPSWKLPFPKNLPHAKTDKQGKCKHKKCIDYFKTQCPHTVHKDHFWVPKTLKGCALTAPGRLRRLTFSFGRLKKSSRSPGRALLLLMQCSVKQEEKFNILVLACWVRV